MRRLAADQQRFGLLSGAARLADTASNIPEVVDRVGALLVPAFADICVIDVGAATASSASGSLPRDRTRRDRGAPARPRPRDGGGDRPSSRC